MEFLAFLILSFLLSIPAWQVARKRHTWFEWDYATVFAPMLIWLALAIVQIGSNGLSNLIEAVIVAVFVPLAVSCRVFLLDRIWRNPTKTSLAVFFLCCVVLPLALRIGMPPLSE